MTRTAHRDDPSSALRASIARTSTHTAVVVLLGIILGYRGAARAGWGLAAGFTIAAVVGIALLATRRIDRRASIPFAPPLAAEAVAVPRTPWYSALLRTCARFTPIALTGAMPIGITRHWWPNLERPAVEDVWEPYLRLARAPVWEEVIWRGVILGVALRLVAPRSAIALSTKSGRLTLPQCGPELGVAPDDPVPGAP